MKFKNDSFDIPQNLKSRYVSIILAGKILKKKKRERDDGSISSNQNHQICAYNCKFT